MKRISEWESGSPHKHSIEQQYAQDGALLGQNGGAYFSS